MKNPNRGMSYLSGRSIAILVPENAKARGDLCHGTDERSANRFSNTFKASFRSSNQGGRIMRTLSEFVVYGHVYA